MSHAISHAQARNIVAGVVHAGTIKRPLNRYITIHWESGSVANGPGATTAFTKQVGDWLSQKGVPLVWVWAREAGPGKGEHVHILMHVPHELVNGFKAKQPRWLKACGVISRKGVVHTKMVGSSYTVIQRGPRYAEWYPGELTNIIEYFLKGAEAKTAVAMGLNRPREFEGNVMGKRAATSQSVGATARNRWTARQPDDPAADGTRIEQIAAMVYPVTPS